MYSPPTRSLSPWLVRPQDADLVDPYSSGTHRVVPPADSDDADDAALAASKRPTLRVVHATPLETPPEPIPRSALVTTRLPAVRDIPTVSTDPPPSRPSASVIALGSFEGIPYVTVSPRELLTMNLDPRRAFVLGLLDGKTSIETVLDASPMPTHKVLSILGDLLRQGLIEVK